MNLSFRWLSRHVDLSGIEPSQLAEDLTLSTAEVEGLVPFAPHLSQVVVGHVVERGQHPDADKLSLCLVDVGVGEPLQIVCGAPNVAAGQKVAVAQVGTVLPGEFKIKKSKIRGVESRGMICSVRELDLGDEHDGIWVLPESAQVARPVAEALELQDWVIEIDNKSITHRPDLWGHRGVAAEIAAIYRRELIPLDVTLPETGNAARFPLRVESENCPRYVGLPIDGVRNEPSPDWMRYLLLAVGQRPIDLVVDLSNFVMLDIGQPNHTFDRDRLSPEGIVVRQAREGERMTTLDEAEHQLDPTDLLICSGDTPVALAGVMGGEGSKVLGDTQRLLLEVANFRPTPVRRTASRLGLRTDSSSRFEKSLDPTLPMQAAGHFTRLLKSIQPDVTFPSPPSDEGHWEDPAHLLELRPDRVRTLLGETIPNAEIKDILERLRFGVEERGGGFAVTVPSARATKDITIEQDLVEEVGRIFRYGNVSERTMQAEVKPPPRDDRRTLVRRIQDRLAGAARFHEVVSYSFLSDELIEKTGLGVKQFVPITNPVIADESRMRRSVAPSLLGHLVHNVRLRDEVRLFEVGKGYKPEHSNERGEPLEVHRVALVLAAPHPAKGARFDSGCFYRLYGVVADLIRGLGFEDPDWDEAYAPPPWVHPKKCLIASWGDVDERGAILSELEPGIAEALGLAGELARDVAVAELSLDTLLAAPRRPPGFTPIPRYPGIKVDVAVALADDTPAAVVVQAIEKAGKGQVVSVELFDLFRGPSLGAGRKSLAYHVLLQSPQRTLNDGDGQKFLGRLERGLEGLGAELRKG